MTYFSGITFILVMMTQMTAHADSSTVSQKVLSETDMLVREAGHAIESAWEAFHKAALGGTLASPEVQTSVERDLMHSRQLLREARIAHQKGMDEEVRTLTEQIQHISQTIVKRSQRKKE